MKPSPPSFLKAQKIQAVPGLDIILSKPVTVEQADRQVDIPQWPQQSTITIDMFQVFLVAQIFNFGSALICLDCEGVPWYAIWFGNCSKNPISNQFLRGPELFPIQKPYLGGLQMT